MLRAGADPAGKGARGRCGGTRSEHGNQRSALRFLAPLPFLHPRRPGPSCYFLSRPRGPSPFVVARRRVAPSSLPSADGGDASRPGTGGVSHMAEA